MSYSPNLKLALNYKDGPIVFTLNRNYEYIYFNSRHAQTMQAIWNVKIALGDNMLHFISNEEDREKAKFNFDKALNGESLKLVEEYGDSTIDARFFYENQYLPIYDPADESAIAGVTVLVFDISSQQLREELLKREVKEQSDRMKAGHVAVWEYDIESDQVFYSSELKEQIGYKDHEIANKKNEWEDRLHENDKERVLSGIRDFIENKEQDFIEVTYRLRHKNGSFVWILSRATLVQKKDGSGGLKLIGSQTDITNLKSNELALANAQIEIEESKSQFESLVNNVNGIIWESDEETHEIKFVSEQVEELFGYKAEEWLKKGFWRSIVHPEDRIDTFIQDKKAHESQQKSSLEYRILHEEGHYVHVRDLIRPKSNKRGAVGILLDITKEKKIATELEAEKESLKNVLYGTKAGTWETDLETLQTTVDNNWAEFMGKTAADFNPMSFDVFEQTLHPEDFPFVEKALSDHQLGKNDLYEVKFRQKQQDGNWVWIQSRGRITEYKDGKPSKMAGTHIDITDQENAQKEKDEIKDQYVYLAENTEDIIALITSTLKIRFVSPSIERVLGFNETEMVGYDLNELVVSDDKQHLIQKLNEFVAYRKDGELECRLKTKNGETIWAEIRVKLIKREPLRKNSKDQFVFSITDITDKKNTQLRLEQQESKYRFLAENTSDTIILLDRNNNVEFVSPSIESLMGYTQEEYLEQKDPSIHVFEDDREMVSTEYQRQFGESKEIRLEYRFVKKSGEISWISTRIQPFFNADGEVENFISCNTDISQRKNAEIKLRNTLDEYELSIDTAKLGIWRLNLQSNRLTWNDIQHEIYGLNQSDFHNSVDQVLEYIHPEDLKEIEDSITDIIENEHTRKINFRIITPAGIQKKITSVSTIVSKENGRVKEVLGINIDVSELAEKEVQLQEALEAKNKLFRELHHRIKNNLQLILSIIYLEASSSQLKDPQQLLNEFEARIMAVAVIHEQLLKAEELENLNISYYVERVVSSIIRAHNFDPTKFQLDMEVEDLIIHIDDVMCIGLLLNELLAHIFTGANQQEGLSFKLKIKRSNSRITFELTQLSGLTISAIDQNSMRSSLLSGFEKMLKASPLKQVQHSLWHYSMSFDDISIEN